MRTGRGEGGGRGCLSPSQAPGSALWPRSCSLMPKPACSSRAGAGAELPNPDCEDVLELRYHWDCHVLVPAGVEWLCHPVRLPAFEMGGHTQGGCLGWLWMELPSCSRDLLGGQCLASPGQCQRCSLPRYSSCHRCMH